MKLIAILLSLFVSASAAFHVQQARRLEGVTPLQMKWFDNPFHGGGSASEDELDEIWETQQAILRSRQGHNPKASSKPARKIQVKAAAPRRAQNAGENQQKKAPAFKMPWDK